jgi:2-dehydro-3-deoxyphosphogluconate aldolase/(4S)-4-hydroxy-2-oxoglutarate aldolase
MRIDDILNAASVIPVLEVERLGDAAPLARALEAGGLCVVELTLRTAAALAALGEMKRAAPALIVGMGTIRTSEDVARAREGGADFLVSPGAGAPLLRAMEGVPALPGVATPSEAMTAFDAGYRAMKFFPAEPAGGAAYLKSLAGPLPDIVFCPTGGITPEKAAGYFALPNVACIGGTWIATRAMIASGDFAGIEANARRAAALKPKRS